MPLLRSPVSLTRAALTFIALTLIPLAAHADTTLSNTANSSINPWGGISNSASPTYGQVVTAPTGQSLLSSFTLNFASGTGGQAYRAYVYAWNGTTTTGSALYTSSVLTAPSTATPVTLNTSSVAVTPGVQYALFFSTLQQTSTNGSYAFGYNNNATSYPNGSFIYNNNGNGDATVTVNSLTAGGWTQGSGDLSFSATFSTAAPEPGSLALLLASGMPALGLIRRRKSSKTAR